MLVMSSMPTVCSELWHTSLKTRSWEKIKITELVLLNVLSKGFDNNCSVDACKNVP